MMELPPTRGWMLLANRLLCCWSLTLCPHFSSCVLTKGMLGLDLFMPFVLTIEMMWFIWVLHKPMRYTGGRENYFCGLDVLDRGACYKVLSVTKGGAHRRPEGPWNQVLSRDGVLPQENGCGSWQVPWKSSGGDHGHRRHLGLASKDRHNLKSRTL